MQPSAPPENASSASALFSGDGFACFEMTRDEIPRLQAFFEANPEYYLAVGDTPPAADEAQGEFDNLPPADWPQGRMRVLRFDDTQGRMIAMANVVPDLIVGGVWHIGLFIVATTLRGRGIARALYAALEAWMQRSGAQWIRLGVVVGNVPGERFWQRCGFTELRTRDGVAMGTRMNTVRVMAKSLTGASLHDYLAFMPRDNPGAP